MSRNWREYWDQHAGAVGREDPHREVQRTANRQSLSAEGFARVASYTVERLELAPGHHVLDLCCGNGILDATLERRCRRVVAVDFCLRLLHSVSGRTTGKTVSVAADSRALPFPPASFDRILVAAALQHFEIGEVVRLFRATYEVLRPGGMLLVTDVPDRARMWRFHDTVDREDAYFAAEAQDSPILGTWLDRTWLEKLGRYTGFRETSSLEQPAGFLYSHYRFDLRCRR